MGDLPVGWRARLRDEFTIGPVGWGLWSCTHMDGSTWALVATRDGGQIIGWACVSKEYDLNPMIGVYVAETERGRGTGRMLVQSILVQLLHTGALQPGDAILAATWRWPDYEEVIKGCGLICHPWE